MLSAEKGAVDRRTSKRDPTELSPSGPQGLVPASEEQMTPVVLACDLGLRSYQTS